MSIHYGKIQQDIPQKYIYIRISQVLFLLRCVPKTELSTFPVYIQGWERGGGGRVSHLLTTLLCWFVELVPPYNKSARECTHSAQDAQFTQGLLICKVNVRIWKKDRNFFLRFKRRQRCHYYIGQDSFLLKISQSSPWTTNCPCRRCIWRHRFQARVCNCGILKHMVLYQFFTSSWNRCCPWRFDIKLKQICAFFSFLFQV
jgi:hypothetical protein